MRQTTPVEKVDGKLTKDMLDEDDVFILDADTTLYVWVGAWDRGWGPISAASRALPAPDAPPRLAQDVVRRHRSAGRA